jgi:helix-turn-helix protein
MSKSTPIKKVKTKKGTKLLKQVQSLATEHEGNKLIHDIESKLKGCLHLSY